MTTVDPLRSTQWLRETGPAILLWGTVFAAAWWIAVGMSPNSWWIGLPTVSGATVIAVALGARTLRLRWSALPRFVLFILARSVVGSVDVALRAVRPKLAIAPAIFEHALRSDRGAVLLATLVSLLPGTLVARLEGGRLVVHSLAPADVSHQEILCLEERIARLLDVDDRGIGR